MMPHDEQQRRDDSGLGQEQVAAIAQKIVAMGEPMVTTPDGEPWFSLTAALRALDIAVVDPETAPQDDTNLIRRVATHAKVMRLANEEGARWMMISLQDILAHLTLFSSTPEAVRYRAWLASQFLPAMLRYGWYDPQTGHAPPPGHELDALEQREQGRDMLHALLPGLGDAAAGRDPNPEEER